MFVVFLAALEFMGMTSPKAALDCNAAVPFRALAAMVEGATGLLLMGGFVVVSSYCECPCEV
jgi:hypothetical protein